MWTTKPNNSLLCCEYATETTVAFDASNDVWRIECSCGRCEHHIEKPPPYAEAVADYLIYRVEFIGSCTQLGEGSPAYMADFISEVKDD